MTGQADVALVFCPVRCVVCGTEATAANDFEVYCSQACLEDEPRFQWRCPCGRLVADGDVCATARRDPSAYYGITDEWHFHCSRCGFRSGQPCIAMLPNRRKQTHAEFVIATAGWDPGAA